MSDGIPGDDVVEKSDAVVGQVDPIVMWRGDDGMAKPVRVECPDGLYPNRDADGMSIYENTHFSTEDEAWLNIKENILAGVSLAGEHIKRCEAALVQAREIAANDAKLYAEYRTNWNNREAT